MNEVTQQNAESARELASTMAVFKVKEGGGGKQLRLSARKGSLLSFRHDPCGGKSGSGEGIRFFPNHPEDIGRLESLGRGRTEGNLMANIVTAKEVGQYLKLSESTIYKLAATGEIPGFKIGDSWRFDMEEILKMIGESKKGTSRERAKPGGEAKWQS